MTKPDIIRGFEHPKIRQPKIAISLAGTTAHCLPRISRVNEAWVADTDTLEVEMETTEGQRVIVPLSSYAVQNLAEMLDQALKLAKTNAGPLA